MASIIIDNLDDQLEAGLRKQASRHGRSVEEEALLILQREIGQEESPPKTAAPAKGLGRAIRDLFADVGGVELELPPRGPAREPPKFE